MVGGTTPPQSDSGEISRVLVLNLLWQSKRCSRTAQDISVLTTPSLLSRAPGQKADSSPLKRIRNDKYLKAGSRRGAPRNDKCVKADSVRLREKSPHPFAKSAKGWGSRGKKQIPHR